MNNDENEYRFMWTVSTGAKNDTMTVSADRLTFTESGAAVFAKQFGDDYHVILALQPSTFTTIYQNGFLDEFTSEQLRHL